MEIEKKNEEAGLPAEREGRNDAFLRLLAHEMRNHLAPIRMAVHMARRRAVPDPALAPVFDLIETEVARAVVAIDTIVDAERVSRHDLALEPAPLALAERIKETVETIRPLCEGRQQNLHVSLPPDGVRLHADAARLNQILTTLLKNASHRAGAGGQVACDVTCDAVEAAVQVSDSGPPMGAESLPEVFAFQPRFKASAEGLGFELAVARTLIELQGGRIDAVLFAKSGGREILFFLPLARQHPSGQDASLKP